MSYYNRKPLLINTLKTIKKSALFGNVEVIVADDCSAHEHRLEDILDEYPFVKIIRLEPENRWYTNPCVPFNKAIFETTGDIIIIQNPECLHMGDIISDVVARVNDGNYLTYAVYSLPQDITENIKDLPYEDKNIFHMIRSQIVPFNDVKYTSEGQPCWYNHSVYTPNAYHFMAAMTRNNMSGLGGFDESFANGIGFDDDEFLYRIRGKGLNVEIIDNPYALHQWHYTENNFFAKSLEKGLSVGQAFHKNKDLFENTTKKSLTWRVNLDKMLKNN